jgi:pimeloyl-ACP methyl ester carboxylesterase
MTTYSTALVPGGALTIFADGAGSPIVLLHAGVADSSSWDDAIPPLTAAGYRVIRYDARDYGYSFTEALEYSPREDLWAVLDAAGVQKAVLVGNSRGGSTAIDAALEQPDRVAALVLVGSGLNGFDGEGTAEEEAAFRESETAFREARYLDVVEQKVRIWVDGIGQPADRVSPAVREHARAMLLSTASREGPIAKLRPLEPPASERLAQLTQPTLIVIGEYDTSIIHEIATLMAAQLPASRVVRMPNAAHMVGMEHPDTLASLIIEHVRALGAWV